MKSTLYKQRILLCFFIVVILTWSNTCFSTVLNVPQRFQEKDQWCWAATSQAVLEYYGTYQTQTQIAQYGTNGVNTWNWLFSNSTNPTRNGIKLILMHFAQLTTAKHYSSKSLTRIKTEINARRPFVIRWGWDSGGGHFVVGKGIEGDKVYLMDPWYGPTINTFNWVVRGSSHTWTHTLTNNISGPLPPTLGPKAMPWIPLLLLSEGGKDDAYEENDTLATAYYPGSDWEQQWLSDMDGRGVQADDDWYRIYVSPNYNRVQVNLQFTHADGDIDLRLYDASGNYLSGSVSTNNNEFIDYTVPAEGGYYYLQVYYADAGNSYNLWWDDIAP